ncbi:MAG: sigma-70 family RNA polymerase sigma factor [Planctomycetota bacterium]|nr:sigma-70 family RNA polymerase sigma factor [Planctomycetota bacterium]
MTLLIEEPSTFATNSEVCELVVLAQTGDRQAFGELVERFERTIYAIAFRRLNNHAEAQELAQEVFVQALEKLDQLRQPECFPGWIRSIAARMSINRAVRRGPVFASKPELFEASCVESETPLGKAVKHETQRQVRAGLRRLGELDRQTLEAFYVRGQSLIEMSDEFDAPVGTIKRRLHVARKRLADELQELAPA